MREVHDLASGMREAIASIRKNAVDAKNGLASEIVRANVNADKVKSLTDDLKEANKEVESFLGESGSNFPPSGDSNTQQQDGLNKGVQTGVKPETDINGVTLTPKE